MAESLKLVGFKRVVDHSADGAALQLSIVNPPSGNVHFFAKWWDRKANQKIYISGAKIAIEGSAYELLIPASFSTRLRIRYDGDPLALVLSEGSEMSRLGVADIATGKVVAEYIAPRIKSKNAKWAYKVLDQATIDGNTPPAPAPSEPVAALSTPSRAKGPKAKKKECD